MALSKEERKSIKDRQELKEKILHSYNTNGYEIGTKSSVNEGTESKMMTLREVQTFLSNNALSNLGEHTLDVMRDSEDINVLIYFMSNNNVKLQDTEDNFVGISFDMREDRAYVQCISAKTQLEKFIGLPMKREEEDGKKWFDAGDVVALCDSEAIYNYYQDRALNNIRSKVPSAYHMLTGPNMYKKMEKREGTTLYVMYDSVRQKFKYAYNPDFILECAIDEWSMRSSYYNSLEDCYIYILAFMMTHEMMHIIHHNTVTDGNGSEAMSAVQDHGVVNAVMDSFINCNIAKRFRGMKELRRGRDIAPMPKVGIGSSITVRAEHNKGFKKFDRVSDVYKVVGDIIKKLANLPSDFQFSDYYSTDKELAKYAGADIYLTVDIKPSFNLIRGKSSTQYQSVVNDIIAALVEGQVFDKFTKITDREKSGDLSILPVGQLVLVKYSREICAVQSYDTENEVYNLVNTDIVGTHQITKEDGLIYTVTDYAPNDKVFGSRRRELIKPYDPEKDAFVSGEGTTQSDTLKSQLSDEDIMKENMPPLGGMDGMPPMPQSQQEKPKILNVGDVVWVRRLKKFGRITSYENGKFNIEEVHETPSILIDDSDNH